MQSNVTVITGSSRGIGLEMSKHYCKNEHKVIGVSRSGSDFTHFNYTHIKADITKEEEVKTLIKVCRREFGYITNLINNAGIATMNHSLTTPATTIKNLMKTNYLGAFLMCREVGKVMQLKHYGRIVNISSSAVNMFLAGEAAYVASKAALNAFSQVLARELAPLGITVNIVSPGIMAIPTKMTAGLSEEHFKSVIKHQIIEKACTFEQIFHAVDYFIDRNSSQITAQNLCLGGA